jgi:hypothetical protein
MADDRVSRATATITYIVVALIGGYVYLFSFGNNDGEYAYAYFIVPIVQTPFAAAAFAVVLRRRRGSKSVVG